MKVTVERTSAREIQRPPNPPPPSDLPDKPVFPRKPPRRKTRTAGAGVRLKRDPSAKRSSRPETPLLRWKFEEEANVPSNSVEEDKSSGEGGRKSGRRIKAVVSARKLGAGLWRLGLPEFQQNDAQKLGLQSGGGGHFGSNVHCHHFDKVHTSSTKDPIHSPHSMSGPKHGLPYKFDPPFQFPNPAMEGATKWDPHGWRASHETKQIFNQSNPPKKNQENASAIITTLEAELEQARSRITDLENKRRSSKKKLEQFLQELSEERATWRSREHEKIRAIIDDMKSELTREKKNRQKLEIVNSKLVNELSETKLSAKRYHQEYEKERKARELIEEVCDELAKEIGDEKAEVEALKRESTKLREEVDEERKMLQMAEVWREERVQMKLVDAKVMLEDKYAQMNVLVEEIESFLNSSTRSTSDPEVVKKAEFLRQVADSVDMREVREMTYVPPNPDDIYSMFEDVNFGESNEEETGSKIHRVSPEEKSYAHSRDSNVCINRSGELEEEEDASEWETVSHRGSSYSPDGNFSRTGGSSPPVTDDDVAKTRESKKGLSSVNKNWRSTSYSSKGDTYKIVSIDGKMGRFSKGRLSCGANIVSPISGLSPRDLAGQWSSPEIGNPHVNRAMKGCIEWPRGAQKNSLKARLMEARMESQKVQLRQVLKQKF